MSNGLKDFGVVGGGIGGCSAAVMLSKNYDTVLFEKEPYLGGCASTFKKDGAFYNSGATTFAGYDKGNILYDFFKEHNIGFEKKKLDLALCVVMGEKKIYRYQDFDKFLDSINSVFYHKKNLEFWKLVYEINKEFYSINDYYYSQKNIYKYLSSILSFKSVLSKFYRYIQGSAQSFIDSFFNGIDKDYLDFLDNQCMIVAQARTKDINFLTAALALGYHFQSNYYVFGGMGSIFKSMKKQIAEVKTNTFINKIERADKGFIIHSGEKSYSSKNLVLNSSIFDSINMFEDKQIEDYLKKYQKYDEGISAYTLYIRLNTTHKLLHHYQLIEKDIFPYSISNSIFVSLGDNEDEKMDKSITISIHTKSSFWQDSYEEKKQILQDSILRVLKERLNIDNSMIKDIYSASPYTFKRYINRASLGGIPVRKENLFFRLPSNETPIKGLYLVGDTSFAAQGWMGVMMGVNNLGKLL